MDTIRLTGLRVFAHHGVLDSERRQGQDFVIDVVAHLDFSEAAAEDDLAQTLDYGELANAIHERVACEQWFLVERVAARVADLVLDNPLVKRVEVTVHKPNAPISLDFDDVSVSITRTQPA